MDKFCLTGLGLSAKQEWKINFLLIIVNWIINIYFPIKRSNYSRDNCCPFKSGLKRNTKNISYGLIYPFNDFTSWKNLIKDYLSPIGLAYWIMDDGGLSDYTRKRGIEIHTGGFTEKEVDLIVTQISTKFDLNCWKVQGNNRKYPIIRFSNKEDKKITNLIKPY